jgi:hypothetical protein
MPWSAPFGEPIRLRGGRSLSTLQDAADYIMKLPDDAQQQERWQVAVENLINAAETGGGWLMFARIAVPAGAERRWPGAMTAAPAAISATNSPR